MFRPFLKNFVGIFIVLFVSVLTFYILFISLSDKSDYIESGTIRSGELYDSVVIFRDDYGVSHIEANNEDDLYFALGYTHAQDRLWQMDLSRRAAQGRLSEIFGADVLDFDKLFRTIGIHRASEKIYNSLPEKTKLVLDNYSNGVNEFIKTHIKELPLEFDVLDYKPEMWKPEHSIMIVRMMGWELNIAWYTEYTFGLIVNKFGLEKAKEFFPNYPEDAPEILSPGKIKIIEKPDTTDIENSTEENLSALPDLAGGFFETGWNYKKYFNIDGSHIGSNAWVISGKKSESKKPILANDPHIPLLTPSRWYEVNLYDKKTDSKFFGFSVPGAPGIMIGSNGVISWGITNLMNDEADFYILLKDTLAANSYLINENSFPLDSITEIIKVKGSNDEIEYNTYYTKYGPVISNLEKSGFASSQNFKTGDKYLVTFRWTGYEYSDEIGAVYNINRASGWSEFKDGLKSFGLPALNFVYADTSNNIGYHAAGKIPIRKFVSGENPGYEYSAIYPSSGEIEWAGFVPFDELPSLYNPEEGYIVTANNKPKDDYKYYISNLYEPHYRALRIDDLLKPRNNYSANEFKLIQNDVKSLQAKDFCAELFESYKDTVTVSIGERSYLTMLMKWNYEFKSTSPEAIIFAQFELELYKNLYKKKLGEDLFYKYLTLNNIPVRNTAKLLRQDFPGKQAILRKSFKDAIEFLRNKFNNADVSTWRWGDLHKVKMKHPLGVIPALSAILDVGPYESNGCGTTINNIQYGFINAITKSDFESHLGPSLRFIIDMSNTKIYNSILPPGQSGQNTYDNYRNQSRLWLNGEYKTVKNDFNVMKYEQLKKLLLLPKVN